MPARNVLSKAEELRKSNNSSRICSSCKKTVTSCSLAKRNGLRQLSPAGAGEGPGVRRKNGSEPTKRASICRPFAFENPADVNALLATPIRQAGSVAHEPAGYDKFAQKKLCNRLRPRKAQPNQYDGWVAASLIVTGMSSHVGGNQLARA
jgi:hypothetical protein